jgi:hypothetical protein
MSQHSWFCNGCNDVFWSDDGQPQCPSCGSLEVERMHPDSAYAAPTNLKGDEDEYSSPEYWQDVPPPRGLLGICAKLGGMLIGFIWGPEQ